jgi:hypothetical protein
VSVQASIDANAYSLRRFILQPLARRPGCRESRHMGRRPRTCTLSASGNPVGTEAVMMTRLFAWFGSVVLLLTPIAAYADPITFRYRIDVTSRCTASFEGGGLECLPFSATFPLSMRFEPIATAVTESENSARRWYAAPSFSAIPLERPDVFLGADVAGYTAQGWTTGRDEPGPQEWQVFADALQQAILLDGDREYLWFTRLNGVAYEPELPGLTPESLGAILGTADSTQFEYQFSVRDRPSGVYSDLLLYVGTVALEDTPAAVPEPTSMLLLASGLAFIGIQRWRGTARGRKTNRVVQSRGLGSQRD